MGGLLSGFERGTGLAVNIGGLAEKGRARLEREQQQLGASELLASGAPITPQAIGQIPGLGTQAIDLALQQQKAQSTQDIALKKSKVDFAETLLKDLVKSGNQASLGPISTTLARIDPVFGELATKFAESETPIQLSDKDSFTVGTETDAQGNIVNVRFNKVSGVSQPFLTAEGEVSRRPSKVSQRIVDAIVDSRTGEIVTGQDILDTPQEFQAVVKAKETSPGVLSPLGAAPKVTPQQKADISVSAAESKKLTAERIKDIEETEDVREKIGNLGFMFKDAFDILQQLPAGFAGGTAVTIAGAAAKAGLESEVATLKGALTAIKSQVGKVAREVGSEKGVLNEGDVQRAFGLIPDFFQSRSQQEGVFQQVQNELNERIRQNGKKNKIADFENFYVNFTGDLDRFGKGLQQFRSEDDAFKAFQEGKIKPGDKVIIVDGRIHPVEVIQ